ncbi:hypothetical protein ACFLYO_10285 [Chloroflexota bacterium]
MTAGYKAEAEHEYQKASRRAFWNKLLTQMEGEESELLDFNEISQELSLRTSVYRGHQEVPIGQIVGSIGRYQDFTGEFLPVSKELKGRWESVAQGYLNPVSRGVPPVELYKVGSSYFVKDGNHRVSVANQLDIPLIEAYVWEYPEAVAGLDPDVDINTLLLEHEHRGFLAQTSLDELRSDHAIRLTAPGGYTDLLRQIANYQQILSQIDQEEVTYAYTVTAWYDMLYETATQIIALEGLLEQFPDRTPADFYVWMTRHYRTLREQHEPTRKIEEVARELPDLQRGNRFHAAWVSCVGFLRRRLVR